MTRPDLFFILRILGDFFACLFIRFSVFKKNIAAISTHRTMTFSQSDCFDKKNSPEELKLLGHLSCVFFIFIHTFQKYVFVHNFLSHQTSELTEIVNLNKRSPNLTYNEKPFSKFEFLHFLRQFSGFFHVFLRFFNENISHFNT